MFTINKILCPTDFSEPSYVGLRSANEFAAHFGAELLVVHVVSYPQFYFYPGSGLNINKLIDDMVDSSKKALDDIKINRILLDVSVRTFVRQGDPPDQIIDLAKTENVDMIVTATHGWTGWRRFVFGSVAEKVVRFSPCPVLTVPNPQKE